MRYGKKIYCNYCGSFIRKDKKFQKYANEEWKKGNQVINNELCNECVLGGKDDK